jgi:hypothetical protein
MMQKSTTFTTIFRVKSATFTKILFACKKVPLSLRYAKKINFVASFLVIIECGVAIDSKFHC